MNAIACSIIIAALIYERTKYASPIIEWQIMAMSMLTGYWMFWSN